MTRWRRECVVCFPAPGVSPRGVERTAMASLEDSLGGNGGGGVRGGGSFFGSGRRSAVVGGGADEGGSPGALHSPWISRLRPPLPRSRRLHLAAAQKDPTAAPAQPAQCRSAAPTHASRTGAWIPVRDLGGRGYSHLATPHTALSPRLLLREAAASSSCSHMLQQERRGAEAEPGRRRREVAREEERERGDMVAGFGPFHVRAKEGLKRQRESADWRLESGWSCRPVAAAFPGTGRENYGSSVGDGFFPFFHGVAQPGAVPAEVGEVAERGGGEEGKGTLCMTPNIRVPSDMGSDGAAGASPIAKNNQWLHRHRWGESSRLLGCHLASSDRPVGNGNVALPHMSGACVGPPRLVDEVLRRRLRDQHVVASAQGAAYEDTIDDTATTGTSFIPGSSEEFQQQLVTKSSFWNMERTVRAGIVSSFRPSLAFDKGVGVKRMLEPHASVSPPSLGNYELGSSYSCFYAARR